MKEAKLRLDDTLHARLTNQATQAGLPLTKYILQVLEKHSGDSGDTFGDSVCVPGLATAITDLQIRLARLEATQSPVGDSGDSSGDSVCEGAYRVGTVLKGRAVTKLLLRARRDRKAKYTPPDQPLMALADGLIWLLDKSANGNSRTAEAIAVAEPRLLGRLRHQSSTPDGVHHLWKAQSLYAFFQALPGFDLLPEATGKTVVENCWFQAEETDTGSGWQRYCEQITAQAAELLEATQSPVGDSGDSSGDSVCVVVAPMEQQDSETAPATVPPLQEEEPTLSLEALQARLGGEGDKTMLSNLRTIGGTKQPKPANIHKWTSDRDPDGRAWEPTDSTRDNWKPATQQPAIAPV